MWSVEELTIQHQTQKVTVVNVKKQLSATGRTDGLGLLYMGYQSVFLGRRHGQPGRKRAIDDEIDDAPPSDFQLFPDDLCESPEYEEPLYQKISDTPVKVDLPEVERYDSRSDAQPQASTDVCAAQSLYVDPHLETILDTGAVKLVKNTSEDSQLQSEVNMPFWVFSENTDFKLCPQAEQPLSPPGSTGSEHGILNSYNIPCDLSDSNRNKCTPLHAVPFQRASESTPINLNLCEQFSIVHYENVSTPKTKSVFMLETQEKDQRTVRVLGTGEGLEDNTQRPLAVRHTEDESAESASDNRRTTCNTKKSESKIDHSDSSSPRGYAPQSMVSGIGDTECNIYSSQTSDWCNNREINGDISARNELHKNFNHTVIRPKSIPCLSENMCNTDKSKEKNESSMLDAKLCQNVQLKEENGVQVLPKVSDLSPCSSVASSSSFHTTPDIFSTDPLSATSHHVTSTPSSSSSSSSSSDGNISKEPGVPNSGTCESDMVSLLSSPDEDMVLVTIANPVDMSLWDCIRDNKSGEVAPEGFLEVVRKTQEVNSKELKAVETNLGHVSLVTNVEELDVESCKFQFKSDGSKPAISYKAYKIDPTTSEVTLSKAKIATYLPLVSSTDSQTGRLDLQDNNDEILMSPTLIREITESLMGSPLHLSTDETMYHKELAVIQEGSQDSSTGGKTSETSSGETEGEGAQNGDNNGCGDETGYFSTVCDDVPGSTQAECASEDDLVRHQKQGKMKKEFEEPENLVNNPSTNTSYTEECTPPAFGEDICIGSLDKTNLNVSNVTQKDEKDKHGRLTNEQTTGQGLISNKFMEKDLIVEKKDGIDMDCVKEDDVESKGPEIKSGNDKVDRCFSLQLQNDNSSDGKTNNKSTNLEKGVKGILGSSHGPSINKETFTIETSPDKAEGMLSENEMGQCHAQDHIELANSEVSIKSGEDDYNNSSKADKVKLDRNMEQGQSTSMKRIKGESEGILDRNIEKGEDASINRTLEASTSDGKYSVRRTSTSEISTQTESNTMNQFTVSSKPAINRYELSEDNEVYYDADAYVSSTVSPMSEETSGSIPQLPVHVQYPNNLNRNNGITVDPLGSQETILNSFHDDGIQAVSSPDSTLDYEPHECKESLTIYLKTKGDGKGRDRGGVVSQRWKSPTRDGGGRSVLAAGQRKLTYLQPTGSGPGREKVVSKTCPLARSGTGLNQFQTVYSKGHHKPSHHASGVGLNQLKTSSPHSPKRHTVHLNLLSPGGSTSSDDGSPYRRSSPHLSNTSDSSTGAYMVASYDDGSEWGEDSLLWNAESEESLASLSSDLDYDISTFEVYSDWMRELPGRLHDVPLTSLAIPGSHISLAIERDLRTDMDISPCNYEMAEFLRKLPNLTIFNSFRNIVKKIWKAWMGKQMLSVTQQLYAGIRYLDIRVTKYRSALYAEHGLYSRQLPRYLKEIKLFLDSHLREVVLLHIGALNQISISDKRKFVTILFQVFGAKMAKCPKDVNEITLKSLWRRKKQVIIIFPNEDVVLLSNHIFAGLIWSDTLITTRQCDNAHDTRELGDFLEKTYCEDLSIAQGYKRKTLHVLRAVMSPDMSLVFGEYHYSCMREMTLESTHPAVDDWITGRKNLNIVACDYVGKGGMIGKVINLNSAKFVVETCV